MEERMPKKSCSSWLLFQAVKCKTESTCILVCEKNAQRSLFMNIHWSYYNCQTPIPPIWWNIYLELQTYLKFLPLIQTYLKSLPRHLNPEFDLFFPKRPFLEILHDPSIPSLQWCELLWTVCSVHTVCGVARALAVAPGSRVLDVDGWQGLLKENVDNPLFYLEHILCNLDGRQSTLAISINIT